MSSGCKARREGSSRLQRADRKKAFCLLLPISLGIVNLDRFGKRRDLFPHLGCITYDDNGGEVGRYELLRHSLNLLGGDCVDAVAVGVQEVARQVEHLDADKLIDQAILRFNTDRKDAAKISLRVDKFFVRHAFVANPL